MGTGSGQIFAFGVCRPFDFGTAGLDRPSRQIASELKALALVWRGATMHNRTEGGEQRDAPEVSEPVGDRQCASVTLVA